MNRMLQYTKTKKIVRMSLFTAIALIIFVIEAQIPFVPIIPGIKLGLANIVTLILISCFTYKEAFTVLIIRIILGSIFSGQMVCFFYSLSGGIFCFIAMAISSKLLKRSNMWFTSIIGGLFHNIGQMTAALIILRSWNVVYYFPVLIVSGIVTGFVVGVTAEIICKRIKNIM